jgi:hypothetical protein
VAAVYDGRRLSLYLDGELDTFVPAVAFSRINTTRDSVGIGMNSGNTRAKEWSGLMDDLRVYSYALPAEEIKALHEGREPSSADGLAP